MLFAHPLKLEGTIQHLALQFDLDAGNMSSTLIVPLLSFGFKSITQRSTLTWIAIIVKTG